MSIFLDLLNDGAFAAIAAIGFASISNPKRSTFWSLGLLAALGHITRFVLMHYCDVHLSLLPMVPGKFAYGSIQALVECMSHRTEEDFNHYFYLLNYNWITCVLTIMLMVVGVTIPLFTFRNHGLLMLRKVRDELRGTAQRNATQP